MADRNENTEAGKDAEEEVQLPVPLWKKILTSPFFWIVVATVILILGINYLEQFTNVEVHNQYQIF